MKKFLFKCLLLAVILLTIVFVLPMLFVAPQCLGGYSVTPARQVRRLMETDEPKIILIGNSNLNFGMDSALLSRETGMQVINAGYHGGMSNPFHERIARVNTRPGDIVIVCHTDYSDDGQIEIPWLIWPTLENHVYLWPLIGLEGVRPALNAYPGYLRNILGMWLTHSGNGPEADPMYSASALNEYGDVALFRPHRKGPGNVSFHAPAVGETCMRRLNRLNACVTGRGATMLIAAYPVLDDGAPTAKAEMRSFTEQLRAAADAPVISDFSDYLYPQDLFFDTQYHLVTEGAEMRTRQLIADIRAWQAVSGALE